MSVHSNGGNDPSGECLPDQCFPEWLRSMGTAVWVRSPQGRVVFMNHHAERLLGVTAERALGEHCYDIVAGVCPDGRQMCGPGCEVANLASEGREIRPVDMVIRRRGRRDRHVRVVLITIRHRGQACVVHCAIDDEKSTRLTRYMSRVATRAPEIDIDVHPVPQATLTRREFQVLKMLAEDESLHSIAAHLALSYATVRNHVQHILSKMGVHSIMEAVACYLLWRDE